MRGPYLLFLLLFPFACLSASYLVPFDEVDKENIRPISVKRQAVTTLPGPVIKKVALEVPKAKILFAIINNDAAFLRNNLRFADANLLDNKFINTALEFFDPPTVEALITDRRINFRAQSDRCLMLALRHRCPTVLLKLATRYIDVGSFHLAKEAVHMIVYEELKRAYVDPSYTNYLSTGLVLNNIGVGGPMIDRLVLPEFLGSFRDPRLYIDAIARIGLVPDNLVPSRFESWGPYLSLRFGTDYQAMVNFLSLNVGMDAVYSHLMYYMPPGLVQYLQVNNMLPMHLLSSGVISFLKLLPHELAGVYPLDFRVHAEERFWMNALLDSYTALVRTDPFYRLGAIVVTGRQEYHVPATSEAMIRDFYNHAVTVKERMLQTISTVDQVKLLKFTSLLLNLSFSSMRFTDDTFADGVRSRLEELKPGEVFALDISALNIEMTAGHVVIGLVSRNKKGLYDMTIINSGEEAINEADLVFRVQTYVEQVDMPFSELVEHYLPIIHGVKNIYLPMYFKHPKPMSLELLRLNATSRPQRGPTCPVTRIWLLAKYILGPELYLEFKTNFNLAFLETLSAEFIEVVHGKWKSMRAAVWITVAHSPLLERALLRQVNKIDLTDPVRADRLRRTIVDSFTARYLPGYGPGCLSLLLDYV